MAIPPKYTYSDLQDILGSNPQLPDQLNEEGFIYDIKNNTKVKWRVNHFLFRRELLALIVDERAVRNWKIGRSLNWLVVLFVAGLSIWTGDYKLLLFLLVYPFIILPVDHWIFIFNVALFIGVKFLFSFNIQYFWLLFYRVLLQW